MVMNKMTRVGLMIMLCFSFAAQAAGQLPTKVSGEIINQSTFRMNLQYPDWLTQYLVKKPYSPLEPGGGVNTTPFELDWYNASQVMAGKSADPVAPYFTYKGMDYAGKELGCMFIFSTFYNGKNCWNAEPVTIGQSICTVVSNEQDGDTCKMQFKIEHKQ